MRGLPKKFRADTASLFLVGFMTHNIRKGFGFRALSVFIRVLFLLKLFFKGAAPALFLYRLLDKIRPRVYFRILKFKPRIVYAPYILTTARSFKICFGWIFRSSRERASSGLSQSLRLFLELADVIMGKGKVIAIRNEVHLLAYTYLNNLRKQDNVAFGSQDVDETSSSDDGLSSPQVSERARYLLHYMQEMRLIRQSEEGPEESEEEQDHVAHHDPLGLFNQDEEDIVAPAAFIDSKQLGSPPAVAGSVSEEEQECLVRLDTDVIVDNGRDFEDSPKPAFSLEELATFGLPLRPTRYFHVRAPVLLFSDQITHISYNFQLFRKTGMLLHWEGTNCCYKRYVFVRHANMSKLRQSFIRNWKQCSKKLK